MEFKKLGEIADILISNVDKKTKENEYPVKLCNFVDVYYNWSISSYHYQNLMNATATKQEIDKFSIREGDVAITKDSETRDDIGVSTYISESLKNTLLGYHCVLIRPNKNVILGKYLNIVLHSSYAQKYFEANAGGSGQRYTLKDTIIKDMLIPIPSIEEQEQLGNLANSIDKKIENNNKINAKLESLAKTIYDYWFLQFEFPNEEGKPYKSSGGKMVWNEKLKREIPEGWEVIYLKDLFSFVKGKNPSNLSQSKTENCNSPYITIDVANLGEPSFCNPQDMIMCHEDVIMVMDGAASGDIYIGCKGVLGSTFSLLKIKNDIVKKEELYMTLLSLKPIYKKCNKGSTVPHANKEFIEQIAVPFPKKRTFNSKLEQIFKRIFELRHENQNLSSLRDFLLPMLMNGQISFSDDI